MTAEDLAAAARAVADRLDVQDTLLEFGRAADRRDWPTLLAVLADRVDLDYGEPEQVDARELVLGRWAPVFETLDATQHLTGPATVTVESDPTEARATACFQATHVRTVDGDAVTWTLGGRYDVRLARDAAGPSGWRLVAVTMTPIWQTGDPSIMAPASSSASEDHR